MKMGCSSALVGRGDVPRMSVGPLAFFTALKISPIRNVTSVVHQAWI